MGEREDRQREVDKVDRGSGESNRKEDLYLGILTKQHLIMISVAVGLVILVIIITVAAVLATKPGSSASLPPFPTGGDMLDFLVQSGEISEPDGLLATWFHRANSKEDMNKALTSDAMILEADITVHGYGTPSEKPIPIMAHPPEIYSDNTLDQWLDAVLASRKGIKLDFKSLESVGLSLDLLRQKNISRGINRPVWLNADILKGPNIPDFLPPVNGTGFLRLIQEKFPDATLSPGWKVAYSPPLFNATYTRSMVEDMYAMVKDVPQKVTFPVHALLVRSGWQHLSWLLSQSPRFSLTLWQGSIRPNINDLLFVRENSHPTRVYYDIYEPTLAEFKQAAKQQGLLRRFYPGGDLMDFLYPIHNPDFLSAATQRNSLAVRWVTVTDGASLLARLSDGDGGMLVIPVTADRNQPDIPLLEGSGKSSEALTLQDILQLLGQRANAPWGVHLQIHTQQLLEASLRLLHSAYSDETLYRPVWISMGGLQSTDNTAEFVSAVERLFPYVTLVLSEQTWPPRVPVTGLSQRVALHLNTASLPEGQETRDSLMAMMDRYDLIVEDTRSRAGAFEVFKGLMSQRAGRANTNLYVISDGLQRPRNT
ncbi:protein FAM151A isoform X1 [Etheostoma spectabile]|uniref:protein FAM151A isoform X1 n=2 Tax=Etheostoma spectabile TaxID=54343 RepID=UPI0013AF20B8|nr:protein FAM151A isoform X1 [Etheostoma spectabile]XP_032388228.1 protein FAM151A isoform X1 [Etheostoma spectabile]XP_032388229.1 protein FAM151A isoform X1 [Etheostoma spectabile]